MGGRIPRRPPNGPGTFCFSMSLRRWLTGGEITISVGKSKPTYPPPCATSFCSWALHVGTETSPTKGSLCRGWRLQQHMWRRHTTLIHRVLSHLYIDYDDTCPHLIGVMGLTRLTLVAAGNKLFFMISPESFAFFFCRTLEIKNFQVLLSWPLSLSLSPRCHSSSSVWFCNWTERSSRLFTPPPPPVLHQPAAGSMSAAAAL